MRGYLFTHQGKGLSALSFAGTEGRTIMSDEIKAAILKRLEAIRGPDLSGDIVSLGLVSDIYVKDGRAMFSISVPADKAEKLDPLRRAAERATREIDGIDEALVTLTAEAQTGRTGSPVASQPVQAASGTAGRAIPTPQGAGGTESAQAGTTRAAGLPGITHVIAVASGKGGVGKSTVTANLALGLATLGLKVGVLDADIYGPSQPRLFGVSAKPQKGQGKTMIPLEGHGLKLMSMGFLVDEATPMVWRGPMVVSAITQMLREVAWGELDVLVVDMPPGTGDAQLTMAQQVPLSGAVIVSTPQDLALIDARKGIAMFQKTSVPLLGVVENMSYFLCPTCGDRSDIFGTGGARNEAEKLGVPFLGAVPLHMAIRAQSDAGTPPVAAEPDSAYAALFRDIAGQVWSGLQAQKSGGRKPPRIVIEPAQAQAQA
jgi:ATP-binding protein involved in chromosome partitioning